MRERFANVLRTTRSRGRVSISETATQHVLRAAGAIDASPVSRTYASRLASPPLRSSPWQGVGATIVRPVTRGRLSSLQGCLALISCASADTYRFSLLLSHSRSFPPTYPERSRLRSNPTGTEARANEQTRIHFSVRICAIRSPSSFLLSTTKVSPSSTGYGPWL